MEQKILLKHPQGKKGVSISKGKYELLKKQITQYLSSNREGSFAEISKAIAKEFKSSKVKFEGSLSWYLEWVKLDLEAQNIIKRVPKTSPQKYWLIKTEQTTRETRMNG